MAQKPNVKNVSSKGKPAKKVVAKKLTATVSLKGRSTKYTLHGEVARVKMQEAKTPTAAEARKALEALARKNTQSRSAAKRYPRYNGKVIELCPPPKFGAKPPSRANRLRAMTPQPTKSVPQTKEQRKATRRALQRDLDALRVKRVEEQTFQKQVAALNEERELERTHQPKAAPTKLKVKIKSSEVPKPVANRPKVIVLRANGYRRPCGPLPERFKGVYSVPPELICKDGSTFPPPLYTDATPLPNLSIAATSWLSERANNDLTRMEKDMRGLSGRCMIEINELAKSGRYKSAPFPEIRRRLIMSLVQELRENL